MNLSAHPRSCTFFAIYQNIILQMSVLIMVNTPKYIYQDNLLLTVMDALFSELLKEGLDRLLDHLVFAFTMSNLEKDSRGDVLDLAVKDHAFLKVVKPLVCLVGKLPAMSRHLLIKGTSGTACRVNSRTKSPYGLLSMH